MLLQPSLAAAAMQGLFANGTICCTTSSTAAGANTNVASSTSGSWSNTKPTHASLANPDAKYTSRKPGWQR